MAAWLRRHDTLTTITRDRSTEYARGIAAGAPQAVQILDRWHLHKNLREAVERVLGGQRQALPPIILPEREEQRTASETLRHLAPPLRARAERMQSHATRERRRRQYEQVRTLCAQGVSLNEITRRLGCSRGLVCRYARADAFPERRPHPRQPSMLDPFAPYYINYLDRGEEQRVRAAYGAETYERLVALKNRYDPTNVFRLNHNIAPTVQQATA